ncbi:hypothetical protein SDC9_210649 [bioreactor metagenome]|uniref:Uncharacterized protein n=1 Tax=bioreactor metagenome TaxID=1076179 RepID=A0A645JHI4_9ZZZZ
MLLKESPVTALFALFFYLYIKFFCFTGFNIYFLPINKTIQWQCFPGLCRCFGKDSNNGVIRRRVCYTDDHTIAYPFKFCRKSFMVEFVFSLFEVNHEPSVSCEKTLLSNINRAARKINFLWVCMKNTFILII